VSNHHTKRIGRASGHGSRLALHLLAAPLAIFTGFIAPARAQTPSPAAEWQYSAGVPLIKLFEPSIPDWEVRLGLGTSLRPRYDGAQQYHWLVGPSIDIRYRDLFFASTGEGIGVNLLRATHWRGGAAITYNLGRRAADDAGHLNGMGNINVAPEAKLFLEYAVSKEFPLVVRADVRRSMGGTDGWIGDLGVYLPLPGSSERFYWFAGPTITFADARYMNAWFGVSQLQAARSGYPQYDPGPGLVSYGAAITAVWYFRKHWLVTADTAIGQLASSAAHSPITQRATNFALDLSINYEF